jgi:hypothetical protein
MGNGKRRGKHDNMTGETTSIRRGNMTHMITRKIFLAVVLLTAILAIGEVGQAEVVTLDYHIGGKVNGGPLNEQFQATMDTETGNFEATGEIKPPPTPNFVPLATGSSVTAMAVTAFALPQGGAENLLSITDGTYEETRTLTIEDDGETIGLLVLDIKVVKGDVKTMQTNGTYTGPTDLVFPNEIDQELSQAGPGLIFGQYTQTVDTSDGNSISITATSVYTYDTDGELPFDEVLHVEWTDYIIAFPNVTNIGMATIEPE